MSEFYTKIVAINKLGSLVPHSLSRHLLRHCLRVELLDGT